MNAEEVIRFIERHGMVLESARGEAVPCLAQEVVGVPISGSWWGHPRAEEILRACRAARASDEVLVCRLLGGKVTLVHRRLWPALARLAETIGEERLAAVREVHTASGAHEVIETPFREWADDAVLAAAGEMDDDEARRLLEPWGAVLGTG